MTACVCNCTYRQEFHTACRTAFELSVAAIADELIDGLFGLLSEGKEAIDLHELLLFVDTAAADLPKFVELGAARFRVYRARHRRPIVDSVRAAPPPRFLSGLQVRTERCVRRPRRAVRTARGAAALRWPPMPPLDASLQEAAGGTAEAEAPADRARAELVERMWLRMTAQPDPAATLYSLLDECAPRRPTPEPRPLLRALVGGLGPGGA
jgi:hypothetical protein